MAIDYQPILAAIEAKDPGKLARTLETMATRDLAAAGTFIGPDRLRSVIDRLEGRLDPMSAASTNLPWLDSPFAALLKPPTSGAAQDALIEVLRAGFSEVYFKGPLTVRTPAAISHEVQVGLTSIIAARRKAIQTPMPHDVTGTLPVQDRCPASLSEADFAAVATRNGITVAAIKAVAAIESGGRSGFDDLYRPKILFEAHHFSRHSKHRFDKTHPHLSTKSRTEAKAYYTWKQYDRLDEALLLDPAAACASASWGKFQVLGSNHNGWPDAISFASAMFESEANHLKAFEAFCIDNHLMRHLKSKDWAAFAAGYNGPSYQDFSYDTKIAAAYKKNGGT